MKYSVQILVASIKHETKPLNKIKDLLTLSRRRETCTILLWVTTDDFTRQRGSSRLERVKDSME